MPRRKLTAAATVLVAAIAVAVGGFFLFGGRATAASPGTGYGMMGGPGHGGMMGGWLGATVQTSVTPADLAAVRDRVERQLHAVGFDGFRVGELMAFTNHDYALVKDASGKPAFELLVDPRGRWLMPEPPSMMWNTSYGMQRFFRGHVHGWPGMMGSFGAGAGAPVATAAAAKARADEWLAKNRPGEQAADVTTLPGYFTIDVARNGATVGMLSVNAATGAVWFHAWHGTFLADRDF